MSQLIGQIGLPLIAVLVPLVVALFKKALPQIPKPLLPLLAAVLGVIGDLATSYLSGAPSNTIVGALVGFGGVGLRELIDQMKKAVAEA